MPKSKISQSSSVPTSSSATNRTPVKINSEGTPKWYVAIMLGLMVIGLLWLVVNYLAGQDIRSWRTSAHGITASASAWPSSAC